MDKPTEELQPDKIIEAGKEYFEEEFMSRFLQLPKQALRRMGFDTIEAHGTKYYSEESIHEYLVELGICMDEE